MRYSYSERSAKMGWSWEEAGPSVCKEPVLTYEADAAVIGAGIAGLTAAVRLSQLGLKVIVAEKDVKPHLYGRYIGVVPEGVDKKIYAKRWLRACGSRVNELLLWKYIDCSMDALSWLVSLSEGAAKAVLSTNRYINPDIGAFPGDFELLPVGEKYTAEGGNLAYKILENAFAALGGKIVREMTAKQLEKDENGRVVSFLVEDKDGNTVRFAAKKAVILAAGDIGGDEEMLSALSPLSLRAGTSFSTGAGDGQKMLYRAGAELEGLYWAPYFACSAFGPYTFFFTAVNRDGKRFMNEDTSDPAKARHCINQRGGEFAFTVCDDKWYDELQEARGMAGGARMMPDEGLSKEEILAQCEGNFFCADTLEELAEKMQVPADTFKKTVARVNTLAANGEDTDYGKRPGLLTSIEKAPFYAFKWGPALHCTFGGAAVDKDMRVLDPDDMPIEGLYAAGCCAGGLYAVGYPSVLSGSDIGSTVTLALAAADAVAQ
ncbi:MAG: FAD-dependent oxidoreductase [Eubacterium sp.]|nr:FAD-dependent oxidoreductase [Eubacterium sp.]